MLFFWAFIDKNRLSPLLQKPTGIRSADSANPDFDHLWCVYLILFAFFDVSRGYQNPCASLNPCM